jgi:uncharacterized damage-inducible protein DinB
MNVSEALELIAYDEWANARLATVVRELPEEIVTRPVASSFGSLRDTLAHIVFAEWVWLRRWKGDSPTGGPPGLTDASRAQLLDKLTEVEAERAELLRSLTDAQLAAPIAYRTVKGQEFENKLADLIRQVVNHSTYHRGQAATQLRQLGSVPPATDFVAYCREASSKG